MKRTTALVIALTLGTASAPYAHRVFGDQQHPDLDPAFTAEDFSPIHPEEPFPSEDVTVENCHSTLRGLLCMKVISTDPVVIHHAYVDSPEGNAVLAEILPLGAWETGLQSDALASAAADLIALGGFEFLEQSFVEYGLQIERSN